MKKILPAVVFALVVPALSFLSPCGANAQPARGGNTSNETYMVVKIIDDNRDESKGERKVEYKAVSSSQLKTEEKRHKDDYTQRMKEWHDLKKTDPTAVQPKRIIIKKIPKLTGYETQTIASEEAKKLNDEEMDKAVGGTKSAK